MIKYNYEDWDIKEGTENGGFDERVYIDKSGYPITGILEEFYGYNDQYVSRGKRVMVTSETIKKARATMRVAFEEDGGNEPGSFKHSYISNMAMLLHDRYDVSLPLANEQAIALLDLIFAE